MINRRPRRLILPGACTFVGRMQHNRTMIDHLSIQCSDVGASARFYDAVLAPLGGHRIMDFGEAIGYGTDTPTFWLGGHETGDGFRESHIAFQAPSRDAVQAFFDAAVAGGAEVLHEPRVWPEYHRVGGEGAPSFRAGEN